VVLVKWYISASEPGHLGVGQNDGDATKIIFLILPSGCFWKSPGCFYDNVLTFSVDGGTLKYKLDNGGSTFNLYLSVGGGTGSDDACLIYNTGGLKTVQALQNQLWCNPESFDPNKRYCYEFLGGFMGYYVGQSSYEILSITDNHDCAFYRRTIQV
jgi:hypothetical protein